MPLPAYEKLGAFYLGRVVNSTTGADTSDLVMYDSRDLTTHAVCVGMTGSGKTGLGIALLEEAAIDGVPALIIDPKGDLTNLLLTFPQLRREDFEPWIDPGEAARKNMTVSDYAQSTADTWKKGLADWQQDGERIARLRAASECVVYTPGSRAGRPLSILRSFAPPDETTLNDGAALKERIGAAVSGLLGLVGIQADPLKSREHILLANLLEHAWKAGSALDLSALIQGVQKPPFDKVGVFDVETFYPSKDRMELAMSINNLLAAPGFDAWLDGEALDVQRLLYTPEGKPRLAIVSIAHLNDAERMFVVTLLLNETVAWMRKQSGTSSLRALMYMDEIFGYFPPSAMPPSKIPLLTLMKQARAFGLGVVLCTQNPVDLDYKGLSNAGTWFIGRLQTERDKARVVEGLLSADGAALDKGTLEKLLANLSNRVFLMRNAHENAPVLIRTRWALSYLRGPLTLNELQKIVPASPTASSPPPQKETASSGRKPVVPPGISEFYLSATGTATTYVPRVLGTVRVHFVDGTAGVDAWETRNYVAPLLDDGTGPDWQAAQSDDKVKDKLTGVAANGVGYAEAPAAVLRAQNYAAWGKQLSDFVYQTQSCSALRCTMLKLTSNPGESEGDFRARLAVGLREKRDGEVDRLRKQYAPKLTSLTDQIRHAQDRVGREQSQLTQQRVSAAISVGTAILGAFLGRKTISATTISRAGTALRSAGRMQNESADVARANESFEVLQQRLNDTQAELDAQVAKLQGELDPEAVAVEKTTVKPRKSETTTTAVALVWTPV